MSNATAQSATNLAPSAQGEDNFDFKSSVERASSRQAKGMTRSRNEVNRNKLLNAVRADYRSQFPAIYSKTDRIPSATNDKLEAAVDEHIKGMLAMVNALNCTTVRRSFSHKASQMKFVEKVTAVGENELSLIEQRLGCTLAMGQLDRREQDAEKGNRLTEEMRKEFAQQKMKLQLTKQFIEGEIQHQSKLVEETKN